MPDGVRQEAYAYLCVHYAIRWVMHTVADHARAYPDRISFHPNPPGGTLHHVPPGCFP